MEMSIKALEQLDLYGVCRLVNRVGLLAQRALANFNLLVTLVESEIITVNRLDLPLNRYLDIFQ
jgi:hypothetical protein